MTPAPTETIPMLVGGHADAALRRAVLKGDGWMHAGGDAEELDRLLARLAEIRKAEGDTRDDFEIHVISYDAYTPDGIKRLEDKGVTDCIVGFRVPYIKGPDTEPLETKIEHLEQVRRTSSIDHRCPRSRTGVSPTPPVATSRPAGDVPCAFRDRRGRGADRQRAVHRDRAGPPGGLRLPRRADPDGDADGLRLRPRPARCSSTHPPVLPAGPRQPRRRLLQRLPPRPRGSTSSAAARHHRRPVVPGDGRRPTGDSAAAPRRAAFDDRELDIADDGTFEIRFGRRRARPLLALGTDSILIVREVYNDWDTEERGSSGSSASTPRSLPRAADAGAAGEEYEVAAKMLVGLGSRPGSRSRSGSPTRSRSTP